MQTECTQVSFRFHPLSQREVVARFDGGSITSDGGGLLLREVERRTGILRQFAACFMDHRDPRFIEHSVLELVGQRVYGLALGYEDLNDHDELRRGPLAAALVGERGPTGAQRPRGPGGGEAVVGGRSVERRGGAAAGAGPPGPYQKEVTGAAAGGR